MPGLPYTRQQGGGPPGAHRGRDAALGYELDYHRQQREGRGRRANDLAQRFDEALLNPGETAGMFRSFYEDAGRAITAPAMRGFQSSLNSAAGGVASRFAGQRGTTEELRSFNGGADVFSRNLLEALLGLSTQGVNAGLDYTQMLGAASGQATDQLDRSAGYALGAAGQMKEKKKGGLGGALGGIIGGAAGAFLGNPGFGAAAGEAIF